MVGGTSFHREILKASVGRLSKSKNNTKSNSNSFLISKNKTLRFSATPRALPSQTLYVSLDNADKVIEGGPDLSR